MLKTALLATAIAAMPLAAQAQWTSTPNIYGQPQFGSTWRGPMGQTYTVTPSIFGQPQYGSTIRGPGGRITCIPNIYGEPQFGTTCR